MKGFLNYIVSSDASWLRQKIIFKVVPMINPDGVVFGNYRTGLAGKDLNRKFKAKNIDLFP
jgi:murein tripeptide amidase MpaA